MRRQLYTMCIISLPALIAPRRAHRRGRVAHTMSRRPGRPRTEAVIRLVLPLLLFACSRSANTADELSPLSPAEFRSIAEARGPLPQCELAPVDSLAPIRVHPLPQSVGTIRLPAQFTPQPSTNEAVAEWRAPGDGEIIVWVAEEPSMGMAATQGYRVILEEACAAEVGGSFALVQPYTLIDEQRPDTTYAVIVYGYPRPGTALTISMDASSAVMRQALLAAAVQLEITLGSGDTRDGT